MSKKPHADATKVAADAGSVDHESECRDQLVRAQALMRLLRGGGDSFSSTMATLSESDQNTTLWMLSHLVDSALEHIELQFKEDAEQDRNASSAKPRGESPR